MSWEEHCIVVAFQMCGRHQDPVTTAGSRTEYSFTEKLDEKMAGLFRFKPPYKTILSSQLVPIIPAIFIMLPASEPQYKES